MGRESKEEKHQRRLHNFIRDHITEVNEILEDKYKGHLKTQLKENGFFFFLSEVNKLAIDFADQNRLPGLREYAIEYNNLKLKQAIEPLFKLPGETESPLSINTSVFQSEEFFKEQLSKGKSILENMSLLISNPEFSNVLEK